MAKGDVMRVDFRSLFSSVARFSAPLFAATIVCSGTFAESVQGPSPTVAAANGSAAAKAAADFVCDGVGDQDEINRAIAALPEAGGEVRLSEGTFNIHKIEGKLGGALIERSNVTLAGRGPATILRLAPGQNTNVIRIIGSGVGNIVICDLVVDANRDENSEGKGDPNVSHARFEFCGIKAFYAEPGGPTGERNHDITIRNCRVFDAHRLGIMLEGANMKVVDNVLGNAGSDAVEILTGPGEIRGNYVEITAQTHVAIGSDRGDNIRMSENTVHVKKGGALDIAFRSWANSKRHVIANNIVTVDEGGKCGIAVDARGEGAVIEGNNFYAPDATNPMRLVVGAGNTIVMGNVLENVAVEVNDTAASENQIIVKDNVMKNARIDYKTKEGTAK
jgi:hypothetical protein